MASRIEYIDDNNKKSNLFEYIKTNNQNLDVNHIRNIFKRSGFLIYSLSLKNFESLTKYLNENYGTNFEEKVLNEYYEKGIKQKENEIKESTEKDKKTGVDKKIEIKKKENGEIITKDDKTSYVSKYCGKYNFDFKYNNIEYTCSYDTKNITIEDKQGNKINKEMFNEIEVELANKMYSQTGISNDNKKITLTQFFKDYVDSKENSKNTTAIINKC